MSWEAGGRFKSEGTYVYLWLFHVDIWQKPAQYCKAVILHLKMNKIRKITFLCSEIKLKGKQILKNVTAEAVLFFNLPESLVKHTPPL